MLRYTRFGRHIFAVGSNEQTARLRSWLEHVVERSASDLLLVPGAPPSLRIDGFRFSSGTDF